MISHRSNTEHEPNLTQILDSKMVEIILHVTWMSMMLLLVNELNVFTVDNRAYYSSVSVVTSCMRMGMGV